MAGPEQPPPQGGLGQSWFVLEFQASYDGSAPKVVGGATPRGTFGPAFVETDEAITLAGEVTLRREAPVEIAVTGTVALARHRMLEIPGVRQPALRLLAARRDDEELLLLL